MKFSIKGISLFICLVMAMATGSSYRSTTPVVSRKIKLGFIPLTDCAPLVAAKELGLFAKYGVDVELSKEASWAVVRDKILNGELDGAHCLFSMPLSVYTGIGGKAGSEMKIAMVLNNNGPGYYTIKRFLRAGGF
jgi:nitrate/nitrite transport system substrate-binding protein